MIDVAILIKNMEMPRRCVGCCFMKIVNNAYVMCTFYPHQGDIAMTDERPGWCPLEDAEEVCMKHYKQGRLDEAAEREGRLMQAFSPD